MLPKVDLITRIPDNNIGSYNLFIYSTIKFYCHQIVPPIWEISNVLAVVGLFYLHTNFQEESLEILLNK